MAKLTVDQALGELPDTALGIATYLIEQECRGVRHRTDRCPIANYLRGTGEFDDLDVDPASITVWTGEQTFEEVLTPEHIAAFIRRFDGGEWPDLIEAEAQPQGQATVSGDTAGGDPR
jgi:hypothetical protein